MRESNLLTPSAQAVPDRRAPPTNGHPLREIRRRRAVTLVPTVRPVFGGYRVSSSCRDIHYLVTQPNGHLVCTCPDFLRHEDQPDFACKHAIAVRMAQEEDRVPAVGNGHDPARPADPAPAHGSSIARRSHSDEDLVRLRVIKNTRGYSWEISVSERDPDAALAVAQDLEQKVRAQYGGRRAAV